MIGLAASASDGPSVMVLGTAQDGGFPQIGCAKKCCAAATADPSKAIMVSSLMIRSAKRRWLVDATPDLPQQIALAGPSKAEAEGGKRPRLIDGIFLTHAHMGHYTGLMHLGREAYSHPQIPVYCTERMSAFLWQNGPWDLLVKNKNIKPFPIPADRPYPLDAQVTVTPFSVPHREEYTDTYGYIIRGPKKAVLFIPDIDKWEKWSTRIEDKIAQVDYALLDGTFFAEGEIPGRAMSEIPHPFIEESLARFAPLPKSERAKVIFIHLNHSNPALDPQSDAVKRIEAAGMRVARQGEVFEL